MTSSRRKKVFGTFYKIKGLTRKARMKIQYIPKKSKDVKQHKAVSHAYVPFGSRKLAELNSKAHFEADCIHIEKMLCKDRGDGNAP